MTPDKHLNEGFSNSGTPRPKATKPASQPPRGRGGWRRRALWATAVLAALLIIPPLIFGGAPSNKKAPSITTTTIAIPMVEVPSVTGKTISQVTAALKKAGLRASARTSYGPETAGKVLSQWPKAGTKIEEDGVIEIVVSGGKKPVEPAKLKTSSQSGSTTTSDASAKAPAPVPAATPVPAASKYSKYTIALDPGHQRRGDNSTEPIGPGSSTRKAKVTGGATGVSSRTPEYQLVLTMAEKIKARLEAKGVRVVMTRTSHDVNLSNVERATIANQANATLAVRIHADGNNDSGVTGISTLYPGVNQWTSPIRSESLEAAKLVQAELIEKTGRVNRGVKPRTDLTGFNWSKVPVILAEVGFLSNSTEDRLLNTSAEQNRIAEAITSGIIAYLETL